MSFPSSDVRGRRPAQPVVSAPRPLPTPRRVQQFISWSGIIDPEEEAGKTGLFRCEFLDLRAQVVPKMRAILATAENYQKQGIY